MSNATIKDGRIYGIKFSEHFNVQLSEDQNPSICPIVDFDGMPLKTLIKLAFDSMKVKGRPAMKNMDIETLKKVYEGVVSWRVLISKEGAAQHAAQVEMSNEELETEIARIQDRIENRQKEIDKEED